MKHLLTSALLLLWMATIASAQDLAAGGEIVIGKQTWSAENLQVTSFRNGDPIFWAKSEEEWVKAGEEGKPACIVYDFTDELGMLSGLLYNWYALPIRGILPRPDGMFHPTANGLIWPIFWVGPKLQLKN